jgi:signal transduction histidine kinase
MKKIWSKISNIGVNESLEARERKSIVLANRIGSIFILLCLLSVLINASFGTWTFVPALVLVLLLLTLSFALNYLQRYLFSRINTLIAILVLIFYMSFKGGYGSGLEYYFLSLIALPVFFFRDKKLIYFFQLICIVCLILQKFYAFIPEGISTSLVHKVFYIFNSTGSGILIILAVVFYKNITIKNEKELNTKNSIIEEKNTLLLNINKQLETFSYSVSHDLKAPLRAIDGYSWILETDFPDMPEKEKELIAEIRKGAAKMKDMIDNLLLLSRSSKKTLVPDKINMTQLAYDAIKSFSKEIENYKTKLTVGEMPSVIADKDLLSHVFENLIGNAIKYSRNKPQPEVEIGGYHEDNNVIYFVKDNGAGFNMKYADKLFIPFQRLHYESEFEGTGVGLSIVKNIVQRHNGKVWVEAKEGEGATFYFSLPEFNNTSE